MYWLMMVNIAHKKAWEGPAGPLIDEKQKKKKKANKLFGILVTNLKPVEAHRPTVQQHNANLVSGWILPTNNQHIVVLS